MKVLHIGDVVGAAGGQFLMDHLPAIKREHQIDMTIVNGENSAQGNGITKHSMEQIFTAGADVITTGNHCFKRREALSIYENPTVLRPANYPDGCAGHGVCTVDFGPWQAAVLNLSGTAYLDPLDNPFTIVEQLLEEMKEHRKIKKAEFEDEAVEMLAKFGFQDPKRILKSYPFELSGGMQQRVGVAAAMLLKPKILLADEPTSALDVSIQKQVVEQMKMIREQYGTTILIVTHNIGVIRAMADSMLVLKDGKMEEYGKTQEVLSHPQSDYTKRLLAAIPVLRR